MKYVKIGIIAKELELDKRTALRVACEYGAALRVGRSWRIDRERFNIGLELSRSSLANSTVAKLEEEQCDQ